MKVGYITIVGKPNAGKSTLINKLVGYKVAITTPKPQTTRYNIKGVITNKTSQMIFVDTPGIHTPHHKLGEYMMKGVESALESVDVVLYLVDSTKPKIDTASQEIMKNISKTKTKVILCITKIDKIKKEKIYSIIDEYNSYFKSLGGEYAEIIPISTYKDDGIEELKCLIEKYLKEGELIYSEDDITDLTQREIVEEIIREKALNNLDEEVPHGIKVEIEEFKERVNENGKYVINITANIICEKMSHKGIIIGKEGSMINKIISEAQKDASKLLDARVKIIPWVKVRPEWQENDIYLKDIKNKI